MPLVPAATKACSARPEKLPGKVEQRHVVAAFAQLDGITPWSSSDVAHRSRFREVPLDQPKGGSELDSRQSSPQPFPFSLRRRVVVGSHELTHSPSFPLPSTVISADRSRNADAPSPRPAHELTSACRPLAFGHILVFCRRFVNQCFETIDSSERTDDHRLHRTPVEPTVPATKWRNRDGPDIFFLDDLERDPPSPAESTPVDYSHASLSWSES